VIRGPPAEDMHEAVTFVENEQGELEIFIHEQTLKNWESRGEAQNGFESYLSYAFRMALLHEYLENNGVSHEDLEKAGLTLDHPLTLTSTPEDFLRHALLLYDQKSSAVGSFSSPATAGASSFSLTQWLDSDRPLDEAAIKDLTRLKGHIRIEPSGQSLLDMSGHSKYAALNRWFDEIPSPHLGSLKGFVIRIVDDPRQKEPIVHTKEEILIHSNLITVLEEIETQSTVELSELALVILMTRETHYNPELKASGSSRIVFINELAAAANEVLSIRVRKPDIEALLKSLHDIRWAKNPMGITTPQTLTPPQLEIVEALQSSLTKAGGEEASIYTITQEIFEKYPDLNTLENQRMISAYFPYAHAPLIHHHVSEILETRQFEEIIWKVRFMARLYSREMSKTAKDKIRKAIKKNGIEKTRAEFEHENIYHDLFSFDPKKEPKTQKVQPDIILKWAIIQAISEEEETPPASDSLYGQFPWRSILKQVKRWGALVYFNPALTFPWGVMMGIFAAGGLLVENILESESTVQYRAILGQVLEEVQYLFPDLKSENIKVIRGPPAEDMHEAVTYVENEQGELEIFIHEETLKNWESRGEAQNGFESYLSYAFRMALLHEYLENNGISHEDLENAGFTLDHPLTLTSTPDDFFRRARVLYDQKRLISELINGDAPIRVSHIAGEEIHAATLKFVGEEATHLNRPVLMA